MGSPGVSSGRPGKALRLEAIQLRLTDELSAKYDLSYRVHVQNIGWMGWVRNGATAGTVGRSLRIEAVQVRLFEKATPLPAPPLALPSAVYRSHVQNIGWMLNVLGGTVSGTTGRSLRLEALQLKVTGSEYSGDILYRAHVQNIGWMSWATSASYIGTTGRGLRLEAFQVKLTGELASHYSIRYRAHVQDIGWQPWVHDGQTAGTTGQAKRTEAVIIELVPKGS